MNAGIYNSLTTEADDPVEPVTVAETKTWARIDFNDDDDLIADMNITARQDIENYTGLKLVDASVVAFINVKDCEEEYYQFPSAIRTMIDDASITINYLVKGSDPELKELDTDYYFDSGLSFAGTGRFKLEYDISVEAVPETLKEAIKMLVTYRYNNRGDQELQQGIPDDVISKIHPYKQIWL